MDEVIELGKDSEGRSYHYVRGSDTVVRFCDRGSRTIFDNDSEVKLSRWDSVTINGRPLRALVEEARKSSAS